MAEPAQLLHGVYLEPDLVARLAPLLRSAVTGFTRTNAVAIRPDIEHTVRLFESVARAVRTKADADLATSDPGSPEVPSEGTRETVGHMTTKDVAAALGTTTRNVRDLADRGSLPGVKTAAGWLFDPLDVRDYAARKDAR